MPDLRVSTDIAYGAHARQAFDLFVPAEADGCPTVLCMHGGWWHQGHHHDLRLFALHLAEQGYAVASLGCRQLGDGARDGKDMLDDLRLAAHKAVEEAAVAGASPRSVALLGSGSGSLLALTLASQFIADAKSGLRARAAIACGVTPALEPWEGCPPAIAKHLHAFANHHAHLFSPMDLKPEGFPPLLLLHGDNDQEVPAKAAHRLHARVIEADEPSVLAVLSGLGHQFIEHPAERGARTALERILPFLQEHAREPEATRGYIDPAACR